MAGAMGGGYGQRSIGYGEQPMSYGQGGYVGGRERGEDPSEISQRGAGMRAGSMHRGRGPRDYKRSDDRIREDVCDRLTDHDDIDASEITVKVEGGEVTLEGTVDDRRLKWMAEELVSSCSGVREVHNQLRLKRGKEQQTSSHGEMTGQSGTYAGNGGKVARNQTETSHRS
jgi:hypothetical protein